AQAISFSVRTRASGSGCRANSPRASCAASMARRGLSLRRRQTRSASARARSYPCDRATCASMSAAVGVCCATAGTPAPTNSTNASAHARSGPIWRNSESLEYNLLRKTMTWPKHGVAAATLAACVAASAPLSAQIQTPVSATSAGDTGSFTVPGGVCFVRLDVAGGLGGASYVPDIVEGGRGARIGARVPVTPGARLDFSVGGAGVSAVVSVPAAGGVGGGGSGGGSGSFGGGGGGGASVVALDGVPIVVAGGGGGGGGALLGSVGGDAGGAGGTGAGGGPGTDDFPATAGAADGTGGVGGYDLHVLAFGGGGGGGVGGGGTVQQDGPGGSGGDGNGVYGGGGGSGGEETSPGGHGSDASPGAGGLGSTVG